MIATVLRALVVALILALVISGSVFGGADTSVAMRVAKSYGVNSFDQIAKMKFTFHAAYNGKETARSWVWDTKADQVTLEAVKGQEPFTYRRAMAKMGVVDKIHKTDAQFINDQYWLLFPLHLAWDSMTTTHATKNQMMPLGGGVATQVTVNYPSSGGYTPGDAYDLYVDSQNRVVQWVYRKANSETPTRTASWKGNAQVGPLMLSLDRPGGDAGFRVWFSNVAVMLMGSDTWIPPKPMK